jgi:hypothetical protein
MADPLPIVCPFCEHVPDNCEVRVCEKHKEHDQAPRAIGDSGMAIRGLAASAMRERDTAIEEVARLRGVLADLAVDHMRVSTERMSAVGDAVDAMEDVLETTHLTKPMREKALGALKELRRVFNAESKSPRASVVHHNETLAAKGAAADG